MFLDESRLNRLNEYLANGRWDDAGTNAGKVLESVLKQMWNEIIAKYPQLPSPKYNATLGPLIQMAIDHEVFDKYIQLHPERTMPSLKSVNWNGLREARNRASHASEPVSPAQDAYNIVYATTQIAMEVGDWIPKPKRAFRVPLWITALIFFVLIGLAAFLWQEVSVANQFRKEYGQNVALQYENTDPRYAVWAVEGDMGIEDRSKTLYRLYKKYAEILAKEGDDLEAYKQYENAIRAGYTPSANQILREEQKKLLIKMGAFNQFRARLLAFFIFRNGFCFCCW